jgi:agmatinase
MSTLQFLDPPAEFTDPASAAIRIIPVPYDATSTYRKGADKGPAALLEASTQVECFDIETRTEVHRRGVHTEAPVECDGPPEALAALVRERVGEALASERFPVVIGGEHSVTIGAVEAAADRFENLSVLQIDAHGDTRESYHGSTHNHACVMARARERAEIVQVGIRAIDRSEWETMDRDRVFWAHEIAPAAGREWMSRAVGLLSENVYVTIDLDAFDPGLVPATGTPEPGGLDWRTVNDLIRAVSRERRVVGLDVVELCPHEAHHASDFLAAKLVHRALSEIFSTR